MSPRGDLLLRVRRSMAWFGLAGGAVGVLDLAARIIILGRWVDAESFGIAMAAVAVFPVLDMLTDLGLSTSVVQKDDHTPEKISTVFWISMGMSLVLVAALALGGPLLARLHEQPLVASLLLAYGAKLVLQNVYFVPASLMRRELRFKEISAIRVAGNLAEFATKIGFAWAGMPVWCFVLGPLARTVVFAAGFQLCHPWRPRFAFRPHEARSYLAFGLKTSASQVLMNLYASIDTQIVGGFFGARTLGLYRAACDIVFEPLRAVAQVVVDVAFPAFARLRRHPLELTAQFLAFLRQNLVLLLFWMAVAAVAAEDMLRLVGGAEFVVAAPIARILCVVGVLRAASLLLPPLLDGTGRPALTLAYAGVALGLLVAAFSTSAVLLGDRLGPASVALGWVAGYPIAFLLVFRFGLREIALPAARALGAAVPIAGAALCALLAGGLARWAALGLPWSPRLVITLAAALAAFSAALAAWAGITVRSVMRALASPATPPDDAR